MPMERSGTEGAVVAPKKNRCEHFPEIIIQVTTPAAALMSVQA